MLLDGHTGTGAAGKVIESFGHFLIGGNFAVGLIVFAVLVVINFIVVTRAPSALPKAACFHPRCHAMPSKLMAIDADLNAGLINEEQAKLRRT